jgi:hypothetical protein
MISNTDKRRLGGRVELRREKELNDFQRNLPDIEILSNLRFGSLEIRDMSRISVAGKLALLKNTEWKTITGIHWDCRFSRIAVATHAARR